MMSTLVQSHPFEDIWRIQNGLLVTVRKHKTIARLDIRSRKAQVQGRRGVKDLGQLKVPVQEYIYGWPRQQGKTFPVGTWVIGNSAVEAISDPKNFQVSVTASGGTIEGTFADVRAVQQTIEEILQSYEQGTP